MAWPDMFPNIPKGIFELRSVEPNAVPSELSPVEGTKKIQMIAFHLISSGPKFNNRLLTQKIVAKTVQSTHYSALLTKYKC